jgi:RNA polymerase sigma-70 factor (ECF subfamily)
MGHPLDLRELYDASYGRLVVQVYAFCGNLADAEDAVQGAFVTALRKRSRLALTDSPEAWIRTVAFNRIRSSWRHGRVVRKHQAAVPRPQSLPEVGLEHVALVAALAQLDEDQRQVLVLHHLADLSCSQIASDLGVSVGTVKSRLSRGRARMAELMQDEEETRHA